MNPRVVGRTGAARRAALGVLCAIALAAPAGAIPPQLARNLPIGNGEIPPDVLCIDDGDVYVLSDCNIMICPGGGGSLVEACVARILEDARSIVSVYERVGLLP